MSTQSESEILAAILLDLGSRPGVRLFRNSTGVAKDNKGHTFRFGLVRGGADLVGWQTTMQYDDRLGEVPGVARFVALEVKTPTGRVTDEQQAFLSAVSAAGGIAAVVRSVEDARRALGLDS